MVVQVSLSPSAGIMMVITSVQRVIGVALVGVVVQVSLGASALVAMATHPVLVRERESTNKPLQASFYKNSP